MAIRHPRHRAPTLGRSFAVVTPAYVLVEDILIADLLAATLVDPAFANLESAASLDLVLGLYAYAFQIYADFSGYSDIAIGTALCLGYELPENFNRPYLSRNVREFWTRWHISLSTWFRDYLYIPLGGSRVGKWKAVRNVFIIFLVSGFWHGANWTFIVWGGIHACLFLPLLLRGTNRRYTSETIGEGRLLPTGREVLGMAWTFTMVCVAWVFFRAESVGEAAAYVSKIGILKDWLHPPQRVVYTAFAYLGAMVLGDWLQRNGRMPAWWYARKFLLIRWGLAALSGWFILKNFASQADFIYFQF